jgi:hypothetical protein
MLIIQLLNLFRNLSVGNGAISILYESVSTSGGSQIRRLQLAKSDLDSFIVGELEPYQLWPYDLAISSPLEMASHATRLAPSSTRETYKKFGLPSTSGDESHFIAYASSRRKSMRRRSKIRHAFFQLYLCTVHVDLCKFYVI